MSDYGREVIGLLIKNISNRAEVVTINVAGCNREIMKYKCKIFSGEDFEMLNEQVANYADMLVIIEGGKNSGTMLLAAKFVEKNKLVYCVPGRINDPNSYACNWLISQGAMILVDFNDLC